ncbi:MAG: hypothetical protein ABIR81_00285 [Ginsengibacter sp.]
MKDKKVKHIEDLMEEYIVLTEEQIEIPLMLEKVKEKQANFLADYNNAVIKSSDAQDGFKLFSQVKKLEDQKAAFEIELAEVEAEFKAFLHSINGNKISYEKKDDNKNRMTFLFWLENDKIQSNRL